MKRTYISPSTTVYSLSLSHGLCEGMIVGSDNTTSSGWGTTRDAQAKKEIYDDIEYDDIDRSEVGSGRKGTWHW